MSETKADKDVIPDVGPGDSVSQVSRRSSSSSSARVRAMAKRAAVAAQMDVLRQQQELEFQELRLKQRKEELELEAQMRALEAKEKVYADHGFGDNGDRRNTDHKSGVNIDLGNVDQGVKDNVNGTGETTVPYPMPGVDTTPEVKLPSVKPDADDKVDALTKLVETIHLPSPELIKFSGDPLRYQEFETSFDCVVGGSSLPASGKLMRLYQSCEGMPKKVIESCLMMDPERGYVRALQLLKERFGNGHKIRDAWIQKVTEGPPVANKSLQGFADQLRTCAETLMALDMLQELGAQRELAKIIQRLPRFLRGRWLKMVAQMRINNISPNIFHVVKFVVEAADEINDPVYGMLETETRAPAKKQRAGSSSFTTTSENTSKRERSCPFCDDKHSPFSCKKFKDMSPEQRVTLAMEKKVCFNCLVPGHLAAHCRVNRTCSVKGCSRRHTRFLHVSGKKTAGASGIRSDEKSQIQVSETSNNAVAAGNLEEHEDCDYDSVSSVQSRMDATGAGATRVALPIVPVKIWVPGEDKVIDTLALLDTGSTKSFCSQRLMNKLKAKGKHRTLKLSTIEVKDCEVETEAVTLMVKGVPGVELRVEAHAMPSLNISISNVARREDLRRYSHLTSLIPELPDVNHSRVELLLGQDVPEALTPLEVRAGKPGEVYAVRGALGWALNGPVWSNSAVSNHVSSSFISSDRRLEEQVKRFWTLESSDVLHDNSKSLSVNDKKAIKIWNDSIKLNQGHYELSIPMREDLPALPDNYDMAVKRLESLKKRLQKDKRLQDNYTQEMQSLLDEGYAEEVKAQEVTTNSNYTWYLPHFPVMSDKKPDKTRIVFDCAAKCMGRSLNDAVLQGPDLTNKLLGVLLRFREEPVAVMSDIRAMFHQVRVPAAERDVLRYLWWPSGDLTQEVKVYRMCVHLFGGTWSPSSCSFALKRTAEDHKAEYSADAVKAVLHSFYVDDCLVSCKSESDAIRLVQELRNLLDKGGFKLTKWTSNNTEVFQSIPEQERSKQVKGLDLNQDTLPTERALGVEWNTETDCITYSIARKNKPLTRRGVLSVVASMYDPYGFAAPFVLKAKIILRDLAAMKLGWDDPVPDGIQERWCQWKTELSEMQDVRVSRCYRPHDFGCVKKYQLHHFSDASEKAYGVVSYVRMETSQGKVSCNIVMAKSRLAPLKRVTLPRLELMAARLAVTMDEMIRRELDLKLTKSVFWTDSSIVLHYINNEEKRFRTFVANRVTAIREGSEPKQWRHVRSELNPADDVTRGLTPKELQERWLRGPEFLHADKELWPRNIVLENKELENDPEVHAEKTTALSTAGENADDPIEKLIRKQSSWYKLKRIVAWLLRGVKFMRGHSDLKGQPLTIKELEEAELKIVQHEQRKFFKAEMEELGSDSIGPRQGLKRKSPLYQLDPRIDKGVLRVGGRLTRSALPLETKHPVILPKCSHVSELILREIHQASGHCGRNYVLSVLREKYWILGAGAAIRSMINRCTICRRLRAQTLQQKMADLPKSRLIPDEPPFARVGMDYFGPFEVKRGRSQEKRYGVMFTCLSTRAIHLELAHSLNTDSCINAIRRFIARRGTVREIVSDNGTNLVGAEKELRKEIDNWNKEQISDTMLQKKIQWRFNPPSASHFGGVWERQIRTVRRLLTALIRQQTLTDESLNTLFCEIENIVNSRPITRVSEDVNDLEALTPNHLIQMNRKPALPPTVSAQTDLYVSKRWRQVQYLADVFWRRWTKEYLPQLQERAKWVKERRNMQQGDLVLIADDNVPRNAWMLARVLETFPDSSGVVRSVRLKTKNGMLTRPIAKLVMVLEADL